MTESCAHSRPAFRPSVATLREWLGALAVLNVFLLGSLSHLIVLDAPVSILAAAERSTLLQVIPWLQAAQKAWMEGHVPLWNPWQGLGAPLLGNYQSAVFLPSRWPLMLSGDLFSSWDIWCLFRWNIHSLLIFGLARRLQFAFWPSVLGTAIVNSGAAQIILFNINAFDLTMAIPALFWLVESNREKATFARWAGLTALCLWCWLVGSPGFVFHAIVWTTAYAAWRGLAGAKPNGQPALWTLFAWGMGALMAALVMLPFFETVEQSKHFHAPGLSLAHLHIQHAISYVSMTLAGTLGTARAVDPASTILASNYSSLWEAMRADYARNQIFWNYHPSMGGISLIFAFVGLTRLRQLPRMLQFGAVILVFSFATLFGIVPLSWIQALPGFSMLGVKDYAPVYYIFVALFIAGGLSQMTGAGGRRAYWVGTLLLALWCFVAVVFNHREVKWLMFATVATASFTILALWGLLLRRTEPWKRWGMPVALLCLLVSASERRVIGGFNQENLAGLEQWDRALPATELPPPRVESRLGPVLPNLLSLAGRAEFRVSDALIPSRYFEWLVEEGGESAHALKKRMFRTFLLDPVITTPGWQALNDAGRSAILADSPLQPDERLEWLTQAVESGDPVLEMTAPDRRYINPAESSLGGLAIRTLLLHAPSRIDWRFDSPSRDHLLIEWLPNPAIWEDAAGDGFWMEASVSDASGRNVRSSLYIQPRRHAPDQRKHGVILDLSGLQPGPLTLTLQTQPGPENDRTRDYPLLTSIRPWPDRPLEGFVEKKIGNDMYLYERDPPPPLGGRFRWSDGGVEGLRFEHVATDGYLLAVDHPEGGVLINADQYYPGWRAWADGKEIKMDPHRVALRQMEIPPGTQSLRVAYQPWAFRLGLWVSLAALLVMAVLSMMALRQRGPRAAGPT